MKTLKQIYETISIKAFNDIILTLHYGDDEWVEESLIQGEEITYGPEAYMKKLHEAGFTIDNFPWIEIRTYVDQLREYLENNLIIPLP